jgi:hypothetical protein
MKTTKCKENQMKALFKQRRQARYQKLLDIGFLKIEAFSLSKVKTLRYYELQVMMKQRKLKKERFDKVANKGAWSYKKREAEWALSVRRWYKRNKYDKRTTDKKREWQPWWVWYDDVSKKLPDEKRYTQIRQLRGKKKAGKMLPSEKAKITRGITNLKFLYTQADSDEERRSLKGQLERMRKLLK